MRLLALFFALFAAVCPALAGETPWQDIAPGVKLRLISTGQIKPDGTTLLGLEIDMPQTSKTYWRVPGDTGLPTELDFSGSTGVVDHKIVWPYPTRHETADYLDYVYFGPTVLPIEVRVEPGSAHAEIEATLGVCSDVCMPAQAHFSLPLEDGTPDRANGLRLRQAVALAPIDWTDKQQPIGDVSLQHGDTMLAVPISDPTLDPASLIASTSDGLPVFGTPQKSPEPNLVLIPILGKGDGAALENRTVQLTFMTDMGAFDVTRTIKGPAAK